MKKVIIALISTFLLMGSSLAVDIPTNLDPDTVITLDNATAIFEAFGITDFAQGSELNAKYNTELTVQDLADTLTQLPSMPQVVTVLDNGVLVQTYEDGELVSEITSPSHPLVISPIVEPRYSYIYKTITRRIPESTTPNLRLDIRDNVYFLNGNTRYWDSAGTPNLTADGGSSVDFADFGTRCEPGVINELVASKGGSGSTAYISLTHDFYIEYYTTFAVGEMHSDSVQRSGEYRYDNSFIDS